MKFIIGLFISMCFRCFLVRLVNVSSLCIGVLISVLMFIGCFRVLLVRVVICEISG